MTFDVVFRSKVQTRTPGKAMRSAVKKMLRGVMPDIEISGSSIHEGTLTYKPNDLAICDDCGHVFPVDPDNDFATIPNLNERVSPGDMVPICECPQCTLLAYPLVPYLKDNL